MLLDSSKVMVKYAERRKMWVTPCKRSAARGKGCTLSTLNSVGVQPTTGLSGCGLYMCLKKDIM